MHSKLTYLFGADCDLWHYPPEHTHFVTPWQIKNKVFELAEQHYPLNEMVVWDMFAGVGNDTVTLAEKSRKVIATELNKETFKCLQENITAFRVKNTELHNIDCTEFQPTELVNLVYFDPPWGDGYESGKDFDFNTVKIGNQNVIELLRDLHRKYGNVIVKSPYESVSFELEFDHLISRIYAFPKPKLKFIFLR